MKNATKECQVGNVLALCVRATFSFHQLPTRLTCHSAVMQDRWVAQVQLEESEAGQEARAEPCCCCVSGVMPASAQGVACTAQVWCGESWVMPGVVAAGKL